MKVLLHHLLLLIFTQATFSSTLINPLDKTTLTAESITMFQEAVNVGTAQSISCSMTEAMVIATGTPSITFNGSSYYIGFRQVSANDQNPVLLKFTNGILDWCREDYDTTSIDVKGYGLYWSGTDLYAVFSIVGQGTPSTSSITRLTTNGWISSYGQGSTASVSVILGLDASDGSVSSGTYLRSQLSNNNTNALIVRDLFVDGSNLVVRADTGFSPLNTDLSRMSCSGGSPIDYTVVLAQNLQSASCASAVNCTSLSGVDCLATLGIDDVNKVVIVLNNNINANSISVRGNLTEDVNLEIYNLNGQLVQQIRVLKSKTQKEFNLNKLTTGIYVAKLKHLNKTITRKIIVK